MDFAPYQDADPQTTRAKSPPPPSTAAHTSRGIGSSLPPPSHFAGADSRNDEDDLEEGGYQSSSGAGLTGGRGGRDLVNAFETSLPMRLDFEAMAAYICLPPVGGVALLIFEHRSDYVRFHAWQSALLFSAIFVVHLIFMWSAVLSWLVFAIDLLLIIFLSFRAYKDADTLDRFEIPFIGRLASNFVDEE